LVLALGITAHAADVSAPVVAVLDGDTIEALHSNHAERILLSALLVKPSKL
jgi:hypothetical protein